MNPTHEAAMRQAIALICSARLCEINSMSSRQEMLRLLIEATDTLRAALAQPAPQPVAWRAVGGSIWGHKGSEDDTPLYEHPPQRKPLTDVPAPSNALTGLGVKMSDLRTAAQQALDALMDDCFVQVGPHLWERRKHLFQVIDGTGFKNCCFCGLWLESHP